MFLDYAVIVGIAVALLSTLLLLFLHKNHLVHYRLLFAIAISSIIASLLFPLSCYALISADGFFSGGWGTVLTVAIALMIHLILVLLCTLGIASFVTEQKASALIEAVRRFFHKAKETVPPVACVQTETGMTEAAEAQRVVSEDPGIHALQGGFEDKNIIEKSVDSENITDKMGIVEIAVLKAENGEKCKSADASLPESVEPDGNDVREDIVHEGMEFFAFEQTESQIAESIAKDYMALYSLLPEQEMTEDAVPAEPEVAVSADREEPMSAVSISDVQPQGESTDELRLSVEEYVDEAFRLKSAGDLEGAILYYMYALDAKPEKELVFWIVVDICSLYKTLGQTALAKDILESYVSSYSDLMEDAVRLEIERNLLHI